MKPLQVYETKRGLWYILGLFLFFAPFAYYEKAVSWLLGTAAAQDFHSACLRVPLVYIASGRGIEMVSVGFVTLLLLLTVSFLFGPLFCGRLCAAGALPEYVSRFVPEKIQINWQKHVPPQPVRYGFLLGFLAIPFTGASIVCAFCNYTIFERLTTGGLTGNLGVLGSTTIVTALLWLGLFGIFARGGRGFCTYLCPAGAFQSLLHGLGTRFSFTHKLCFSSSHCIGCGLCAKKCPTGSLQQTNNGRPNYQLYSCITCRNCTTYCPRQALQFGRGNSGWSGNTTSGHQEILTPTEV